MRQLVGPGLTCLKTLWGIGKLAWDQQKMEAVTQEEDDDEEEGETEAKPKAKKRIRKNK